MSGDETRVMCLPKGANRYTIAYDSEFGVLPIIITKPLDTLCMVSCSQRSAIRYWRVLGS